MAGLCQRWRGYSSSVNHLLTKQSQVEDYLKVLGYAYANMLKDRRAYDKTVETSVYVRWVLASS